MLRLRLYRRSRSAGVSGRWRPLRSSVGDRDRDREARRGGGAAATLIGRQHMAVLSENASKALSKSPSDLAKSPIDLLFSSIALHCRLYKKPSSAASHTSGEEPEK